VNIAAASRHFPNFPSLLRDCAELSALFFARVHGPPMNSISHDWLYNLGFLLSIELTIHLRKALEGKSARGVSIVNRTDQCYQSN
jgi:hydrogenase/urease accessory protein HupE